MKMLIFGDFIYVGRKIGSGSEKNGREDERLATNGGKGKMDTGLDVKVRQIRPFMDDYIEKMIFPSIKSFKATCLCIKLLLCRKVMRCMYISYFSFEKH